MTHRARRVAPTLPARRGMRAPWFRGRSTDEGGRFVEPAADPATGPAGAAAGAAAPPEPEPEDPAEQPEPIVAPVRPAFGHPTF